MATDTDIFGGVEVKGYKMFTCVNCKKAFVAPCPTQVSNSDWTNFLIYHLERNCVKDK